MKTTRLRGAATRRHFIAAAAATLLATTAAGGAYAAPAPDAYARIGAALPLAQFHADGAARAAATATRAGAYASVLAGEPVPVAAADVSAGTAHMQFQVRAQGGVRYLAEASRTASVVAADPRATDAELAARAMVGTPAADRLERIRVIVDNERQDLLAVNGAVADDFGSRMDVGPERARGLFASTLQSLAANRLVDADGLALQAVRAQRLMQGEQAPGQPAVTRVKEYLFEVPHAVAGIEIFGAGTTVAVHRSGQIASIRSMGPTATPTAGRAVATRLVSAEALASRARAEHPQAQVVALGLRYPWQATTDATRAVRPHEVFQVIPQTEVDGQKVNGRARYVFYSVEDERAAPLVWPQARPEATGDTRK